MPDFPFTMPESLISYLVQYADSPEKTIHRLQKQLDKRGGPDAVGYFLLGWLYYKNEMDEKAITCALKAKIFAPGSPFFEKLHYFFKHPQLFNAWQQKGDTQISPDFKPQRSSGPIRDLDQLIEKLSTLETRHLKNDPFSSQQSGSKLSENSDKVDDIVSETLAKIHARQGKIGAAIQAFEQLKKLKPEKEAYFIEQIERLQKKKNSKNEDS